MAKWGREYLPPDLLNDYIRLATVSIAMGLAIGIGIVIIEEFYNYFLEVATFLKTLHPVMVIVVPVVGITFAYELVVRFSTTKQAGGGSHRLLEAYHYEGGVMTQKDTVFEPLASAITMGAGGSAGFEGPSLLLGGGIGSLIAQRLNLEPHEAQRLLISGAAAGVAAVFKAPLTGIMFALEIPYRRDLSRNAFIPATLASISAYFVAVNFLGTSTIFPLIPRFVVPRPLTLLHAFAIGIITAIIGTLFVRVFSATSDLKTRVNLPHVYYPIIGGVIVGVTGLFLPQVTGIGYETVNEIVLGLSHSWSVWLLLALVVFKIIVTSVTLTSGGSGGVFVPTLFVGAALGSLYVRFIPVPDEQVLIVAAMASMIASSNKTLLTSVVFVSETAGPSSIIFTLIAAATSYFISRDVSFYEEVQPIDEFSEEEETVNVLYHILSKQKGKQLVEARVDEFMSRDFVVLRENMRIEEALVEVQGSRNRVYPVTRRGQLIGQTTLEDLLTFPPEKRKLQIGLLPMSHPDVLTVDDTVEGVVRYFMHSESTVVWIVDDREKMRVVGIVTENNLMLRLMEAM